MKTKSVLASFAFCMLSSLPIYAQEVASIDSKGGGGGDASESRVNEIRSDILSWINKGGAKDLILPAGTDLRDYTEKMLALLQPKVVVVNFVDKDHETNEELQVIVEGKPKTCRGFFSKQNRTPNILCNIARFAKTSESEQYRLIHHEYAGLAYLEQNDGSASDYSISNQITDYLVPVRVLKLAVKPSKKIEPVKTDVNCGVHMMDQNSRNWAEFEQVMIEKGYFRTSFKKSAILIWNKNYDYSPNELLIHIELEHKNTRFNKAIKAKQVSMIPDPKRAVLKKKMEMAQSVAEYELIKKEISETDFFDIPAISSIEEFKKKLPTCTEFYGSNPKMH